MSPARPLFVLLLLGFPVLACGDDDGGEQFDDLPACVDDHPGLGEVEGIAHCLLDFPELHPDFADEAACAAWVGDQGYAESAADACADYFEERDA